MAVDSKTLAEIARWGREFCKGDRARAAAQRSSTKPEGTMSVSKALAESRRRAGSSTGTDITKAQTGTGRFCEWINGTAKTQAASDQAAVERATQRMQKNAAPSAGANSANSNPRPQQVDANGRMTGDIKDPGIGAGRVTPLTVASTADGGGAAIWDFFHPRRNRNGSN